MEVEKKLPYQDFTSRYSEDLAWMASLTVTSKILLSKLPMAIIESEEAEDFCKEKKGGNVKEMMIITGHH